MNEPDNTVATAATIDEELVAYLDGELDVSGATRIERRLADDPAYRARLAQLERAWDMLDSLHRVEAHDDFARSTVEVIAVKAIDDAKTGQKRYMTEVVANQMIILDPAGSGAGRGEAGARVPSNDRQGGDGDRDVEWPESDDFDDDLPF